MSQIDQALTYINKMSKTNVLIIHEITNGMGTSTRLTSLRGRLLTLASHLIKGPSPNVHVSPH